MARLRAGKIHNVDPRIPSHVLADLIEKSIAQDMLVESVVQEGREFKQIYEECERKEEIARGRSLVAGSTASRNPPRPPTRTARPQRKPGG